MKRIVGWILLVALIGMAGADPFDGNTLRYSINVKDECDITALGDTDIDLSTGTGKVTAGSSGFTTAGPVTISGILTLSGMFDLNSWLDLDVTDNTNASLDVNQAGTGNIVIFRDGGTAAFTLADGGAATFASTVSAENLYSTDDGSIADDFDVVGDFTAGTIASDANVQGVQLVSTATTGTAPLTIASTTVSTNLNADLLDGQSIAYFATDAEVTTAQADITELHSNALLKNGTLGLTANWDAGSYEIRAETFESDVATGTAPFTLASTTVSTNLNADFLDGQTGTYYAVATDMATAQADILEINTEKLYRNGTIGLTANWDAGSYEIRAQTLNLDVENASPMTLHSTAHKVDYLDADKLDGQTGAYYATASDVSTIQTDFAANLTKVLGPYLISNSSPGSVEDGKVFIAPWACKVVNVSEVHEVAGTDGSPVTLMIEKCTGTTATGSGTDILQAAFDLKGTANTEQWGTLSATPADYTLAAGDKLVFDFTGATTALAGGAVTITIQQV
jgi:hypothetical protein